MKKLGRFIIRNRVVLTLITIIIVCGVLALYFGFKVFWGDTSDNKYGTRLDIVEQNNIVFTEEMQKTVTEYLASNKNVSTVEYEIQGLIIYVRIDLNSDLKLATAQKLCANSLKKFDSEVIKYYNVQFDLTASTVENSKIYPHPISGYKSVKSDAIAWNNS